MCYLIKGTVHWCCFHVKLFNTTICFATKADKVLQNQLMKQNVYDITMIKHIEYPITTPYGNFYLVIKQLFQYQVVTTL